MDDLALVLLITIDMAFEALIVSWLSGKWAFKLFMRGRVTASPEVRDAVASLIGMSIVTPVRTGRKVKDEDGHEVDEVKPLFVYAGRELFHQFELYMRSKAGGNRSGAERAAESDPELGAMMSGAGIPYGVRKRRKDEPLFSYLAEVVAMSPQGQQVIGNLVESKLAALIPK